MKRRLAIGVGTAVAVLAAGGGVAALTWPAGEAAALVENAPEPVTTIAPGPAPEPPAVQARIDRIPLAAASLPQRATKPFSMVSVNWTDPAVEPAGAIEVRTRSVKTGKWSGWYDLEPVRGRSDLPIEKARERGATEPHWAGRSDGVAVRVAGGGGLPDGLRVNLIDPDAKAGGQGGGAPEPSEPTPTPTPVKGMPPVVDPTTAPTTAPTTTPATEPATATPAPEPTTATTTVVPAPTTAVPVPESTVAVRAQLPPYVSRAGWKADESLVKDPITVAAQAKMVWVHHTGFRADYTCAESASIIRGIQANDVRNDGMSDLGYNFLIDKCGTLYEGRKGGVTKAVVGAHSVGWNTGTVGVALLGDYTSVQPSGAALTTFAQLSAARLGAYGFSPTSTATMTATTTGRKWPSGSAVTFPRIAGHKDGQQTATGYLTVCPGTNLNAALPQIRSRATQMITGLAVKSLAGGASVSGTFYVRTAVTVNWTLDNTAAAVARFEVLRDGQVAATLPGTARAASIALSPGARTVAVRAVHTSGGTAVTPGQRVIADVTAPAVAAPSPALRSGTYSATAIPVTAHFQATDNAKLWQVTATAPARVPLSTASTYWYATMRPAANTTFTVTARDVPGNARTVSATRRAAILPETAAKRTGAWTARPGSAYLSGRALASAKKGTKLTYTFTGRSAALLFARGAATGRADVYLDGKKVATIDTRAAKNAYRQAVWVRSLTAKKHTVTIVVAGTSKRPTVISDGLAYIS
ncbi:MAG: N-acetylmuramoyl-L-alanine amidase [Actinoplanes sp.]